MDTCRFNGYFPGKPGFARCRLGLDGCPLDSQSPFIFILSILTGQAETLHIFLGQSRKAFRSSSSVLCLVPSGFSVHRLLISSR